MGCNSYRFASVQLNHVSVEFWQLFRARAPLELVKLKTGPGWLSFAPETYQHSLWCNLYRFQLVQLKKVSIILTTFPGSDTTEVVKVKNQARKTWFCTRNIPTLFGMQFLSFPVRYLSFYLLDICLSVRYLSICTYLSICYISVYLLDIYY